MTDADPMHQRGRELFSLDPAVAYLNHGAFGAVPIPVQRAQQRLRDEVDANPMAFYHRGLPARLAETRAWVAGLLGSDPEGTALVANATAGTQTVLGSLGLVAGDEVLLTDHGYGAVRMQVRRLAETTGIVASEVPVPLDAGDEEIVASIVDAVRPDRTRLVIVDHVTSPTARLFPVARIVAALRERGVAVLVDGAHAPGMLALDISALGADFWLGNLHKWAFAARPTAALVVAPQHRARMQPLVVSWWQDDGFPGAVEFAGTLDYTAWLAAPTALDLLTDLDINAVRRHNADLAAYGQRTVADALDLDPACLPTPSPEPSTVSMRLIPLPPGLADDPSDASALAQRIATELRCEVPVYVWQGRGMLRLSAQIYNRPEDYERLADGLRSLRGLAA